MFDKVEKYIPEIASALRNHGALLVSGKEPPNIMAISWGSVGFFWSKPVFIVAVRRMRHSYKLIEDSGVFTVNVARKDMQNEIMKIAVVSGRDVDKFNEFHLHPVKAKSVDTYIVGDCGLHLECRVLYKSHIDGDNLDNEIKNDIYEGHDYHTLFYAEITDIYES